VPLVDIPPLLRDEPALTDVLGRTNVVLAVPEPARAVTVAGLAKLSRRHPIVVATATTGDAERLHRDLVAFLGADVVELFPAWETLPFERVSPTVETMGLRMRTMWRLRAPERTPLVVVASVRALVQRLGPHVDEVEPLLITRGAVLDPTELVDRLVASGYRREYQVEHRGEVAVRGSIVDVFPSTADVPIRVDLWGDEVDRLTEFAVGDQRSTVDVDTGEIFPCRELLPTDDVRSRAAQLVAEQPWGREQWERLSEGLMFDGMESWLPWLTSDDRVLFDLLDRESQVVLVDPRRMRDRAGDILAEEDDLERSLAKTWGAVGDAFPKLHVEFDRLLAETDAPVWTMTTAPEGPDVSTVAATLLVSVFCLVSLFVGG
jgi:transcription-repair coupling factor (superfamily II helicase)